MVSILESNLCVVTRNRDTYFIKRLIEEVGDGLCFYNPWSEEKLPEASHYLMRTTGVYGDDRDLEAFQSTSGQVINPVNCLRHHRRKSAQYHFWENHGIPVLPWKKASEGPEWEIFVVKPDIGQGGWGICVLRHSEWAHWWEEKKKSGDTDYLVQKFGEGEEYRVFFINDQQWVLKREGETGIANFAIGGSATVGHLSTSIQDQVNSVIQLSGAHYGAIDLIVLKDGTPTFLELNTAPGIEQLEKVSGENIIRELLSSLGFKNL